MIAPNGTEVSKWITGEDPRVFESMGQSFLVTNYLNNMKLLQLNGMSISSIWILPFIGKNVMPISLHEKSMVFLDIQNKIVYNVQINATSGYVKSVTNYATVKSATTLKYALHRNPYCGTNLKSCIFRGGTTGVKICGGWSGLGHCTYCPTKVLNKHMTTSADCQHKPYLWYTKNQNVFHIFPVCLSSQKIIDPTTFFKNRLITTESDTWWFTKQQLFANREYVSLPDPKTKSLWKN